MFGNGWRADWELGRGVNGKQNRGKTGNFVGIFGAVVVAVVR